MASTFTVTTPHPVRPDPRSTHPKMSFPRERSRLELFLLKRDLSDSLDAQDNKFLCKWPVAREHKVDKVIFNLV